MAPSNPELLAAYGRMSTNPFWLEYRKRLAALRDAAVTTVSTAVPEDAAGLWNLSRAQGAFSAFRVALSLPESIVGLHDPEGK